MRSVKRLGFTLIELLIVIAIISILAAILFPVFATAREKARQTTCASNEKQILMACLQYTQDYDEYVVTYSTPNGGSGWDVLVQPYIASIKNGSGVGWEQCPDDTVPRTGGGVVRSYAMNGGNEKYDYQADMGIDGPAGGWTSYGGAPSGGGFYAVLSSQVQIPTTTILLAELPASNNISGSNTSDGVGWPAAEIGTLPAMATSPVHSGGWNYGFCDGHVKWYQPTTTIGTNNVGTCGSSNHGVGTLSSPCGMWTLDPND